jgi:CO/xanthine dehydrogenase Mo-binding subunit
VAAHDVGTVLNPIGHQGQINGGVVMGIGGALFEELPREGGVPTALSFAGIKVPSIADVPSFETTLVRSGDGTGPYNVKSVGESPILAVAPAIANAIRDAVGVRLHSLPMTAEKVRVHAARRRRSLTPRSMHPRSVHLTRARPADTVSPAEHPHGGSRSR